MGLFDKAKDGIVKGVKFIGKTVSDVVTTIRDDVAETRAEKTLQDRLSQQFNLSAQKFTMIVSGEEIKQADVYAQVDYEASTLTFLGEVKGLNSQAYFIDEMNRRLEILLIKLKQTMDIIIDNTVYPSSVTVVNFRLVEFNDRKN